MKPGTITTLEQLQHGDKFKFEKHKPRSPEKWIKIPGEPLRRGKEKFECWATPAQGAGPVPLKGNTTVIFLSKTKRIYI